LAAAPSPDRALRVPISAGRGVEREFVFVDEAADGRCHRGVFIVGKIYRRHGEAYSEKREPEAGGLFR
jgi:hypothetical protein